jgi:hypothetical protein
MAIVMRRVGLIGHLTVVTNLGDSMMRARLAKGTLNALGAHDVAVARGTAAKKKARRTTRTYDLCQRARSHRPLMVACSDGPFLRWSLALMVACSDGRLL